MIPETPPLLRERLRAQYGPDLAGEIERGFIRRPVTLRVNPLRTTREQVLAELRSAQIDFTPVPWYEDALILPTAREEAVRQLDCYAAGGVYLQSLSSMLPALVLRPQGGEAILDMAAAPGGKTTQMAALSGGGALITACEKNPLRAERLQFNLTRQGAGRVSLLRQDARTLNPLFRFDKVLLDAPCSGSGTVILAEGEPARRMEAEWLRKITATQKALLKKALSLLTAGHEMVYSTCSILREENEDVLEAVLPGSGAEVVPIDLPGAEALPLLPTRIPGAWCLRPDALFEGFFVAKIRRKK